MKELSKPELQEILDKLRVGYFTKHTVDELIKKIINKQKRENYILEDLEGLKDLLIASTAN